MQGYSNLEQSYVSPLVHKDVILETPWFHRVYAKLEFPFWIITLTSRDRDIKIRTKEKGNTIPIVSNDSIQKLMKSSIFV